MYAYLLWFLAVVLTLVLDRLFRLLLDGDVHLVAVRVSKLRLLRLLWRVVTGGSDNFRRLALLREFGVVARSCLCGLGRRASLATTTLRVSMSPCRRYTTGLERTPPFPLETRRSCFFFTGPCD